MRHFGQALDKALDEAIKEIHREVKPKVVKAKKRKKRLVVKKKAVAKPVLKEPVEMGNSSILCLKCNNKSRVKDCRRIYIEGCGSTMVRYRACRECNFKWQTYEISKDNFNLIRRI